MHPNDIVLKACEWQYKPKHIGGKMVVARLAVGGQCCYETGSSGLLTVTTDSLQIEIQLSVDDCKELANRLLTDATSWAKEETDFRFTVVR